MQNIILAALFVIQHKLNSYAGLVRPIGMWRLAPIANHVAWIITHI